jgi:hypothetical protein
VPDAGRGGATNQPLRTAGSLRRIGIGRCLPFRLTRRQLDGLSGAPTAVHPVLSCRHACVRSRGGKVLRTAAATFLPPAEREALCARLAVEFDAHDETCPALGAEPHAPDTAHGA